MDGVSTSSYKMPTGLRHAQSLDNISWSSSAQKKLWPAVDENCPLHGSRNKCTCGSFVCDHNTCDQNGGMGSTESLNQFNDFGPQAVENNEKHQEFVSPSVKPFQNNPPLPTTQRDIVGNNLRFNSRSLNNSWMDTENDQLAALLLYRDALKKNLTTQARSGASFPRMRHGRIGSQWRHIKQTNTYSGSNLMFIDGTVRVDDSLKFPIPRFGYPPMQRPQHKFMSPQNDSFTSANPETHSLDSLTWSRGDTVNRRPSLTRYIDRYQHHARDNISQNSSDSVTKKPLLSNYSNIESKDYEIKQTLQERVKPRVD